MDGTASAGSKLLKENPLQKKKDQNKKTQNQKKTPPQRQATCLHSHVPERTLLHIQRGEIINNNECPSIG